MAEEEQEMMISHFSHHHPFTPIPVESRTREMFRWCVGCWRYLVPGEAVYGCSNKCGHPYLLHKECLEMPIKIRHPLHPSHPLKQVMNIQYAANWVCAVCEDPAYWRMWCYICSEGCDQFFIHLTCAAQGVGVGVGAGAGAAENEITMKHPSHPPHGLKYLRRPCSFQCNACGTTEEGSSYGCTICQYWIHESCARLPHTQSFPRHHSHHPLSLAFSPF